MNARLGGCSFIYPGESIEAGLARVAALGFASVDVGVGGANGHLDPAVAARDPALYGAHVRDVAAALGLRLNECFTLNFGAPINTPDAGKRAATRELFAGLARFAQTAGFASVMLIPGPVDPELGPSRSLDLAVAAFTELAEIAAAHDVRLHVEADCDSCASTPATAARLAARVPGLQLTLDYSHYIVQGIAQAEIEPLHAYTGHVHVRQAAPGAIVAPAAAGTIDLARMVASLEASGYQGLYTVEYLYLDATSHLDLEEETRAMAAQLDALLPQDLSMRREAD